MANVNRSLAPVSMNAVLRILEKSPDHGQSQFRDPSFTFYNESTIETGIVINILLTAFSKLFGGLVSRI